MDERHHRQPRRVRRRAAFACTSGHVLVHCQRGWGGCSIDGGVVGSAFRTLADCALIDEFHNPEGFEHIRYFRLSRHGHEFASRALQDWERRPLLSRRLGARLLG